LDTNQEELVLMVNNATTKPLNIKGNSIPCHQMTCLVSFKSYEFRNEEIIMEANIAMLVSGDLSWYKVGFSSKQSEGSIANGCNRVKSIIGLKALSTQACFLLILIIPT